MINYIRTLTYAEKGLESIKISILNLFRVLPVY